MDFHIVIPARFGSTRLPGKPLLDIAGKSMIEHVYARCCESSASSVWVATDDARIAKRIHQAGGQAIMTRPDHVSGTDRLQEVATQLALADGDIVVNVQGDEPLIPALVIDQVAANLASRPAYDIATLCELIKSRDDVFKPSVVKVVSAHDGRALYFSRAPMPWHRDGFAQPREQLPQGHWYRHIGIYAYRVALLHRFVNWPVAEIEAMESLEQLRAMANGALIHVDVAAADVPAGIDTAEDLVRVRHLLGARP